jgi:hypothetical protein
MSTIVNKLVRRCPSIRRVSLFYLQKLIGFERRRVKSVNLRNSQYNQRLNQALYTTNNPQ